MAALFDNCLGNEEEDSELLKPEEIIQEVVEEEWVDAEVPPPVYVDSTPEQWKPEETHEFNVSMRKEYSRLGMDTSNQAHGPAGPALFVKGIHPGGVVEDWNKTNPSQKIAAGDFVVEVSGVKDDPEKIFEMLIHTKLPDIKVYRGGKTFTVSLVRRLLSPVGLQAKGRTRHYFGQVLEVAQIKDGGLFAKYNATTKKEKIQAGDVIVEMNGIKNDHKAMAESIHDNDLLDFVVRRKRHV